MNENILRTPHLRLLGVAIAVGLSMVLLVPPPADAGHRGFGRGYHGGYRGVHRAGVYGGRVIRGGYARSFVAGAYAGGYGYGTGYNSTRYAMYGARHSTTNYTGIPTGASIGYATRSGLIMAQKQVDQQYMAAVEQARAMDKSQGEPTRDRTPRGADEAAPESDGPPPVGTTFHSVMNAHTVSIDNETYFVSNGVYFQAFYHGSDVVYKVVEAPDAAVKNDEPSSPTE